MIAEWEKPFLLTTPQGFLHINEPQGGTGADEDDVYLLDETKCSAGIAAVRTTQDDVPQGDGAILHRIFKSYYTVTLHAEFWLGDTNVELEPACAADRVRMLDRLMLHANSLVDPALADLEGGLCRLQWTPSGAAVDRMINEAKLLTWPAQTIENPVYAAQFELWTPFPYAMDVTERDDAITASVTVTNPGTADFYPVFKVHGPCGEFFIQNATSGLEIAYLGAGLPGGLAIAGGHYAEINTFHNTIFLDGSSTNLMAGIDVANSDFWKLLVGPNALSFTNDASATCEMLWNPSWA